MMSKIRTKDVFTGLFVAYALFVVQVLAPNIGFIKTIIANSDIALLDRLSVVALMSVSVHTAMSLPSAIFAVVVAILFGVNVALVCSLFRQTRIYSTGGTSTSVGASLSAVIGASCTSCGAVILSLFVPFGVAVGLIATLPFDGLEFMFVATALLSISAWRAYRQLGRHTQCPAT